MSFIRTMILAAVVGVALPIASAALPAATEGQRTTVVLVHGAFADGSAWDKVIPLLLAGNDVVGANDVIVGDAHRGPGYGHVTRDAVDAVRFLASHEGLLLEPVYSAKAFAGLLAQARRGEFAREENILFVMTGGTPALFAYREQLSSPPPASFRNQG